MATTPFPVRKTCILRADAPVFIPRKAAELSSFKLNPAASEYKPSKGQQALDQLLNILSVDVANTTILDEAKAFLGNGTSGSVASSPGRTYAASSSSGTLVEDGSGNVSDGNGSNCSKQSPHLGVLHHHHIHHHSRRLLGYHREARVHHAEFVGSVEHHEHAVPHVRPISSTYIHIQPHGATQHVPYRPYQALEIFPAIPSATSMPNYGPIPCEAYLLDHPLRNPRTGYWEVPKAQPIRHRYTEADLALFRSTHKDYKIEHGIPLYAATQGSQSHTSGKSSGNLGHQRSVGPCQTMAREYHAQNTQGYCELEGRHNVYGRAEGFWYGWY